MAFTNNDSRKLAATGDGAGRVSHSTNDSLTPSTVICETAPIQYVAASFDVPGYVLAKQIGKGGMGNVYRARDLELDRDVAVKILQDRFAAGSQAANRFLEEARISGQLQHPGIPAVYRAARLADGRPFLAMKLIKGQTLDDLLKAGESVNHLAIMEAVAQAVGYAHAHDVIHRDLKPQNVMVGSFGEVQVMDWGLAKVLTSLQPTAPTADTNPESTVAYSQTKIRTSRESDYTQAGSVLGTPAYMPPEQAAGEAQRVGKASDVFGLGALWCKLLTGHPPFTGADAESVRRNALRGKTEEALARLDACDAEPEVISLCKKCLAVEPEDRPQDANAVAEQIAHLRLAADERARQAEVAKARAEVATGEQIKRRHLLMRSAAVVATVLVLGLIGTSIGVWRANTARHAAVQAEIYESKARRKAESESARADAVNDFLQRDVLCLANPLMQLQEGSSLRYDADLRLCDVVLRAAQKIEGKFSNMPLVEAEIRHTLGTTLSGMGRPDLAVRQFDRVLLLHSTHSGPDHLQTLSAMYNLATNYAQLGRSAEALKLHEEAFALCKTKLGPGHLQTLANMRSVADDFFAVGRRAEALKLHEETFTLCKTKFGSDHWLTLACMSSVASDYFAFGRRAEGLKLNEEMYSQYKNNFGADHPDTLKCMINLASSYQDAGRRAEALKLREEAFALQQVKLGPDHPDTLEGMHSLANSYSDLDRQAEARNLRERTLALRKIKLGLDHPDTLRSMHNLAVSFSTSGQNAEAIKLHEKTLALRKTKLGLDHSDTLRSMLNLGISYQAAGRPSDAIKLYEEGIPLCTTKLGPDHPDTLTGMHNLARSYYDIGRFPEALKLYEKSLAQRKVKLGPNHFDTLASMNGLAGCYFLVGRHAEALMLREETLARRRSTLGPTHPDTLWSMHALAGSYFHLNRQAEALKLGEETLALRKAKFGPDHPDTFVSEVAVIQVLLAIKRPADIVLPRIDELTIRICKAASAGQQSDRILINTLIDLRLGICRESGNAAGCRATAAMLEKRRPMTNDDIYKAACCRAVAAAIQSKKAGSESARLAKEDADRAMALVAKVLATGAIGRNLLEKETDFEFLRTRDDFKKLLASMPPAKPKADQR